jgi:hypothetical protein
MNVAVKNEMAPPKAMVVAPKGAPVRLKGATLKGKSGVKRPSDKELALAKAVEQSKKFSLALPSILASGQGVAGASSSPEPDVPTSSVPAREDDGRVELISMLGLASSAESSSLSSNSLVLGFAGALRSNLDAMTSIAIRASRRASLASTR